MATTVVKKNTFFGRFFSSVGAIFVGILLILGSTIGLIWNEGRSVKMTRAIDDVEKVMIDVGSAQSKSENEGKLIGVSGDITFTTAAADSAYNITSNSFALARYVEVYEWRETKNGSSSDAEVQYTYELVWTRSHINSGNFYDKSYVNPAWPTDPALTGKAFYSTDAKLGDFKLTESQLSALHPITAVNIPATATLPSGYAISSDSKYITNSAAAPAAGDVRIYFNKSDETQASALGKQQGTSILDYTTKNNVKINRIFSGIRSGAEMIEDLTAENTGATWVLRILFTIMICAGFAMLFTPIKVLISYLPFIGKFLGNATEKIAGIIGMIIGIVLSLIIIALAWIAVRPIISIPLLVIVVLLIVYLVRRNKKNKTAVPTPEPPKAE